MGISSEDSDDLNEILSSALRKNLPPDLQSEQANQIADEIVSEVTAEIRESTTAFRGPIPSPEMLREYNSVVPGLADRIVQMAIDEQNFRHEGFRQEQALQVEGLREGAKITRLGQHYAVSLALICVISGVILLSLDKKVEGLWLCLGPLAALTVAFMTGKIASVWHQSEDDQQDDGE